MLNKKLCAVVIPVYKAKLDTDEILSLKQCLKILNSYDIFFVTHKELDHTVYEKICAGEHGVKVSFQYFPKQYFANTHGYNSLLLSRRFYMRFSDYEFILIYQLDAWVFSDQLQYWCGKQYDYIGAPWLQYQEAKKSLMPLFDITVGNGGFSLRRIQTFLEMCSLPWIILWRSYNYIRSKDNIRTTNTKITMFGFIWRVLRRLFLLFYNDKRPDPENEDVVFSYFLFLRSKNVPAWKDAMRFSFETCPEYCLKMNGGNLPFGAHNIAGYDQITDRFWSKIILNFRKGRGIKT